MQQFANFTPLSPKASMLHPHEPEATAAKYEGDNFQFANQGQEDAFFEEHGRWLRFVSFEVISDEQWSGLEKEHKFVTLPNSSYGLCLLSFLVDVGFKNFLTESQARAHSTTIDAYRKDLARMQADETNNASLLGLKKRSFLPVGLSIGGGQPVSSGGDGKDEDSDDDEKVESYKSLKSTILSSKTVAGSTGSAIHPVNEHHASAMRQKPATDDKSTSRPILQRLKKRFGLIFFFFLLGVIIVCTSLPTLLVVVFFAIAASVFCLFADLISIHRWAKFFNNIINATAPALVSFFIQGSSLAALYGSLPFYGDPLNSGFCTNTSIVQCGLLAVFYSTLVPTAFEILHELMTVYFADMACFRQASEAGSHVVLKVSCFT